MKFILVMYLCSVVNGQCPSQSIPGWQFENHSDCVDAGYAIAQKNFRLLPEVEEFDKEFIEQQKIVIKFECKEIKTENI